MKNEKQEAEKVVLQLNEAAKTCISISTAIRTEQPASSLFWLRMAGVVEEAAKMLENSLPTGIEIEGGGSSWWYVCEECRGAVDTSDSYCKHCGRKLIKDGILCP